MTPAHSATVFSQAAFPSPHYRANGTKLERLDVNSKFDQIASALTCLCCLEVENLLFDEEKYTIKGRENALVELLMSGLT